MKEAQPTERPDLPVNMEGTFMVQGKEYRIGARLTKPYDSTDVSYLLYRDLDPTHDRVISEDKL